MPNLLRFLIKEEKKRRNRVLIESGFIVVKNFWKQNLILVNLPSFLELIGNLTEITIYS